MSDLPSEPPSPRNPIGVSKPASGTKKARSSSSSYSAFSSSDTSPRSGPLPSASADISSAAFSGENSSTPDSSGVESSFPTSSLQISSNSAALSPTSSVVQSNSAANSSQRTESASHTRRKRVDKESSSSVHPPPKTGPLEKWEQPKTSWKTDGVFSGFGSSRQPSHGQPSSGSSNGIDAEERPLHDVLASCESPLGELPSKVTFEDMEVPFVPNFWKAMPQLLTEPVLSGLDDTHRKVYMHNPGESLYFDQLVGSQLLPAMPRQKTRSIEDTRWAVTERKNRRRSDRRKVGTGRPATAPESITSRSAFEVGVQKIRHSLKDFDSFSFESPLLPTATCECSPMALSLGTDKVNIVKMPLESVASRGGSVASSCGNGRPLIPTATLKEFDDPKIACANLCSQPFSSLLDPSSPFRTWLWSIQERSDQRAQTFSWQHKMLYRPRRYLAWRIADLIRQLSAPQSSLSSQGLEAAIYENPDYRAFLFYRRLIMGFQDNWCIVRPIIFPLEPPRSQRDSKEWPQCGFAENVAACAYVAPFTLRAIRVPLKALKNFVEEVGPSIEDFCGPSLLDACFKASPKDLLLNQTTPVKLGLSKRTTSGGSDPKTRPTPNFFGLPWEGRTRLVARTTFSGLGDSGGRLVVALASAAAAGELLAVTTAGKETHQAASSPDDDFFMDSSDCPQQSEGCSRSALPRARSENVIQKKSDPAGRRVRQSSEGGKRRNGGCPKVLDKSQDLAGLIVLIGGKDMLALDWLPFVSRQLHQLVSASGDRESAEGTSPGLNKIDCNIRVGYILFEMPGYGFSSGWPSPQTCVQTCLQSLKKVVRHHARRGQVSGSLPIHLVGYSLGSSIVIKVLSRLLRMQGSRVSSRCYPPSPCGRRNPADNALSVADDWTSLIHIESLTLIAAPTTIAACAADALPLPSTFKPLAVSIFSHLETDTLKWNNLQDLSQLCHRIAIHARDSTLPSWRFWKRFRLTIIHGSNDGMVRPEMGRALHAIASEVLGEAAKSAVTAEDREILSSLHANVKLKIIPGADHLSIAAEPTHQREIYDILYDPEFVCPNDR